MDTTNAISGMPLSMKLYIGAFIVAGVFGLSFNHEIIESCSLLDAAIAQHNIASAMPAIENLFLERLDMFVKVAFVLGAMALGAMKYSRFGFLNNQ